MVVVLGGVSCQDHCKSSNSGCMLLEVLIIAYRLIIIDNNVIVVNLNNVYRRRVFISLNL